MKHSHAHDQSNTGNLKLAFFLNFGFTIFELIGGVWTNSIAIVADALHDLGDSFSLGLAWFLDHYAQKRDDPDYSYGYRRYSLLGALINALGLIGGGLMGIYEAGPRLLSPEPTYAPGMIVFAVVGITVNGLAAWRLKGGDSLNAKVVGWHLLEDVLGWVAVLVVSILLLFFDFYVLDPLLSILITIFILYNVVRNLGKTIAIFLQAVPEGVDLKQLVAKIQKIDAVQSTHHTHAWSLDGQHHVMSTHVVVPDEATKSEILQLKRHIIDLTQDSGFEHVTIEVEYENEDCRMRSTN
ncbi:MAG TPA: cation diffusion facilitator family transporter [Anaerolineae bacterium]|nr:cation diffusion facilitator family transporter [Anaerolineae bacterium]